MKYYSFVCLTFFILMACSSENEIRTPDLVPYLFYEEFLSNTEDGVVINTEGWANYVQTGSVAWEQGIYHGSKYAEFTAYGSGESSNIGWFISPGIDMELYNNEKLAFDVAQAYVSSAANSIEVFVSEDYDGANVASATWISIPFAKPPLVYDSNFAFYSSGIIDLSPFNGTIHIAFKVTGSGTNTALDGTYEIDNIRVFNQD